MNPKYEKLVLALTVGYFIGSWFLMDYGIKNGDIKMVTAPLIAFIATVFAILITFSIKLICCPRVENFSPLSTSW